MCNKTVKRPVVVKNREGLHMRPGEIFARLASQFESTITVVSGPQRVDGKSLLDLITLGAAQGAELEIEASGADAADALDALSDLIERESFDELITDKE